MTIRSKIGLGRGVRVLSTIRSRMGLNRGIRAPLTIRSKIGFSGGVAWAVIKETNITIFG